MSKGTFIIMGLEDIVIPNKEDIKINSVVATDNFGNTYESSAYFLYCENEDGEEISEVQEEVIDMVKTLIKYKIPRKNETLENVSDWVHYYINVERAEFLICLDCEDFLSSCCCDCPWGGADPDNA